MPNKTLAIEFTINQGSYSEVDLYFPSFNSYNEVVPTNITGATITSKLRITPVSTALISLSSPTNITITDAVNGRFKLKFPVALTSAITKENMVLRGNVEITIPGQEVFRSHDLIAYFNPDYNW